MAADFLAGLVAGTGLGIIVDPRLRGYIADKQWRSGIDLGALTNELLERMRADDPRDTHERLPRRDAPRRAAP
jgi:hypothetical protein